MTQQIEVLGRPITFGDREQIKEIERLNALQREKNEAYKQGYALKIDYNKETGAVLFHRDVPCAWVHCKGRIVFTKESSLDAGLERKEWWPKLKEVRSNVQASESIRCPHCKKDYWINDGKITATSRRLGNQ